MSKEKKYIHKPTGFIGKRLIAHAQSSVSFHHSGEGTEGDFPAAVLVNEHGEIRMFLPYMVDDYEEPQR